MFTVDVKQQHTAFIWMLNHSLLPQRRLDIMHPRCLYSIYTLSYFSSLGKQYVNTKTDRLSSVIRQSFFLPKQSQRSRSILQDGSRSLGLFRKGKNGIIAKFHRTNLVI